MHGRSDAVFFEHSVGVGDFTNDFAGNAARKHSCGNVARHHAARGNDAVVSDFYTPAHDDPACNPDVVADFHGLRILPVVETVGIFVRDSFIRNQGMTRCRHGDSRSEHDVVSDCNGGDIEELAVEIHIKIVAEAGVESVLHVNRRLKESVFSTVGEQLANDCVSVRNAPSARSVESVGKTARTCTCEKDIQSYGVVELPRYHFFSVGFFAGRGFFHGALQNLFFKHNIEPVCRQYGATQTRDNGEGNVNLQHAANKAPSKRTRSGYYRKKRKQENIDNPLYIDISQCDSDKQKRTANARGFTLINKKVVSEAFICKCGCCV